MLLCEEEPLRQRKQHVTRPWGSLVLGVFEDQPGGQCRWRGTSQAEAVGDEGRGGMGQVV